MAITFGAAKLFAVDVAHDMAADKADRLAHRWIVQALRRIARSHPWTFYGATRRYTLDEEETDGLVTLTEGGTTAVLDSNWPSKYATQKWRLLFDGDAAKDFVIASIATVTGTFATGQVWTQDSTAAATYRASRNRYDLPDDFVHRAEQLWHLDLQQAVRPVPPDEYDRLLQSQPGYRSAQPLAYTIRDNDLWIWPPPGSGSRPSLELTYIRAVTVPAFADADATELDWPDDHEEVLWLAIEVEAARFQGKAAQIPLEMCLPEFERALASAKGQDTERASTARAFGLSLGGRGIAGGRPIVPYIGLAPGGL